MKNFFYKPVEIPQTYVISEIIWEVLGYAAALALTLFIFTR